MNNTFDKLKLRNRVAIITGGAGILGVQHAEVIAEAGGIPILWDINRDAVLEQAQRIQEQFHVKCIGIEVDITEIDAVKKGLDNILTTFNRVDILINNAANDPKVETNQDSRWSRFENYALEMWNRDISVSLTGAFLCSQTIGSKMVKNGKGVILNIASDLGVIAPDQRIYRKKGAAEDQQPVKPVTYSVVKHGLIGLTKYLATYWADKRIRVNALCPGGVYNKQPDDFVKQLTNLIPMGRMAEVDEYKASVLFLVSDASSYMTGSIVIIDGGRTSW